MKTKTVILIGLAMFASLSGFAGKPLRFFESARGV
jgi:hypothetical protein